MKNDKSWLQMNVLNTVGHGLHKKIYENALVVEMGIQKIPLSQQPMSPVVYKSVEVGKYIPDLICYDQIVVDVKTIEQISNHEIGLMLNYLKITSRKLGLIVNFKNPTLEWQRVVSNKPD